jgi:hypothetical protein
MSLRKKAGPGDRCSDLELRARIDFTDELLLAECDVHTYRASGPGGQKRNKTSSAVRLHHGPSGLIVAATESRSQHENKARALRRLREVIAVETRVPLPAEIRWPENVSIVRRRLEVSRKNPSVNQVVALVLDALAVCEGRVSDAAESIGVTSSSLARFLGEHPKAWAAANGIRARAGLAPLRKS